MSSDDLSLWEAELAGVRPLGAKSAPRRKGEASRTPATSGSVQQPSGGR